MNRAATKRFILVSSSVALALSFVCAFTWARHALVQSAELQREVFNRQLETSSSSLTQLASFLAEPGDLNKDGLAIQRLNRFVYGNPGIAAIQLITGSTQYVNTNTDSGQYINGGIKVPQCGLMSVEANSKPALLVGCEDGNLGLLRRFEDFNGKPFVLKLLFNLENLPGGAVIRPIVGSASSLVSCGADPRGACSVEIPGLNSSPFFKEFLPVFLLLTVVFGILGVLLVRLVIIPVRTLNAVLGNAKTIGTEALSGLEGQGILRLLRYPVGTITELVRTKTELEQKSAAAFARDKVAEEVVHNIRSPLAALHGVEPELADLPEETKVAFRSAVSRIEDIVNLLDPQRSKTNPLVRSKALLSSLVGVLLSEKRRQYADRSRLTFTLEDRDGYGLFAQVEDSAFKTVLSNLINNAVESIPAEREGRVLVKLSSTEHYNEVSISDNGTGIPEHIRQEILREGFTYGKENGKGLGLYHAATVVNFWKGEIVIDERAEGGTIVRVRLPKVTPPKWFVPAISLSSSSSVAVLDDDVSVHHMWRSRIGALAKVSYFQSAAHLQKALDEGDSFSLILADYELIGETDTGLSLVLRNRLVDRAILVTSRFENADIRSSCEKLNLRLLPKALVNKIPVQTLGRTESELPKRIVVLLDDDPLVHMTWKMVAERASIQLRSFLSPGDFFKCLSEFDFTTPIYVDFNLKAEENGLQICERLRRMGYRELTLATGASFDDLPRWLKKIGKDAPFSELESNPTIGSP